jgi:hypothetical protein
MSSDSCRLIRTLQFDIDERLCSPSEIRRIAGLVRRRLPGLEQLTVVIIMSFQSFNRRMDNNYLTPGLAGLGILPLHVTVKFRYHTTYHAVSRSSVHAPRNSQPAPNYLNPYERAGGWAATTLRAIQIELSLIGQKRREEQAKRERRNQVCDILEATIKLRSLVVG